MHRLVRYLGSVSTIELVERLIKLVVRVLIQEVEVVLLARSSSTEGTSIALLLARREVTTFIQVVAVTWQCRTGTHGEHELLVLLQLLLSKVVLDEHVTELLLQQVVPLDLAAQVLSKLLVSEDELLDRAVLLVRVDLLHLGSVESLLKGFVLASELLGLLGTVLIADLVLDCMVLFPDVIKLDLLLVNHTL